MSIQFDISTWEKDRFDEIAKLYRSAVKTRSSTQEEYLKVLKDWDNEFAKQGEK